MSEDDTPPGLRAHRGEMSLNERLESMDKKLETVISQGNSTTTDIALIKSKLALHDYILMSVCGIVGTAVIGAILIKVIH